MVMKKMILMLLMAVPFCLKAQTLTPFYPELSDVLQQVFCDYVTDEAEIKYLSNRNGQYIGHLIDNTIYGWGYYLSDDDAQTVGQFRKGKHVFGITLTSFMARVGSDNHFVEYDLETGKIIRLHTEEGDVRLTAPYIDADSVPSPYGFNKITYANGDVYYGETYNGRRHGYGIYYWNNGDFWYGRYRDGYRQGYGALFKTNHHVFYGKWIGDNKVE